MLKKNKWRIIISSIIVLLPMLFGAVMWNSLPDVMTVHFGADGNADGLGSKTFAVFGIPAIMLALQLLCIFLTLLDKKQCEQSPKALGIIFWIVPIISLLVNGIMYRAAFGMELDLQLFGLLFIIMGNYMPKVRQNRTLGIKITWALRNEENWNKTHRFCGKLWVLCGFVMLVCAFLPLPVSLITAGCILLVGIISPMVYSYAVYRRHKKQGIEYTVAPKSKAEKSRCAFLPLSFRSFLSFCRSLCSRATYLLCAVIAHLI